MDIVVKEKDKISVHYTGTLSDGEVFDSSVNREPLAFEVGAGQMIAGFDNAVVGMKLREKKSVTIPASEAYGEVRPEMIQKISKDQLPPDINPQVGQQLASQLPSGEQLIVTVSEISESDITIDANHALAGKDLTFEIEVISIN
ncbi:MAG: peptidylprolyl isomerase [Flavobacteriales bacterium]|nr:peptidylprolyl isomerase [Flavobacteriales bacterium]